MNSDILLGKWRQLRGYFKQSIGKFSGDYLLEANGIGDRMQGTQQENFGNTPKSNPPTQEDRKVTQNEVLLDSDNLVSSVRAQNSSSLQNLHHKFAPTSA